MRISDLVTIMADFSKENVTEERHDEIHRDDYNLASLLSNERAEKNPEAQFFLFGDEPADERDSLAHATAVVLNDAWKSVPQEWKDNASDHMEHICALMMLRGVVWGRALQEYDTIRLAKAGELSVPGV